MQLHVHTHSALTNLLNCFKYIQPGFIEDSNMKHTIIRAHPEVLFYKWSMCVGIVTWQIP
jgi:hypothetical protein